MSLPQWSNRFIRPFLYQKVEKIVKKSSTRTGWSLTSLKDGWLISIRDYYIGQSIYSNNVEVAIPRLKSSEVGIEIEIIIKNNNIILTGYSPLGNITSGITSDNVDILDNEISKIGFEIYSKEMKTIEYLHEELSQQDLEDILMDINDLTSVKYRISSGVLRNRKELKPNYRVDFEFKDLNITEYKEFIKIMDDVIGRLQSTYNIEMSGRITKVGHVDLEELLQLDSINLKEQFIIIYLKD
jgi:hypothetical protein